MRQHRPPALSLIVAVLVSFPAAAAGDQATQPSSPAAGRITAGLTDTCAIVATGARCWGFGGDGRLGYGSSDSIGDDETPSSVGPIDFGAGRTATAISAGSGHTCALLDDGTVRCWGFGGDGRLGYASTSSSPAGQAPGAAGPVDLGSGRTAVAISAGDAHTCAVLDDGNVRCWGWALDGRLGYANQDSIGDNEPPANAGPVDLGGAKATAVSAGAEHTCALLVGGDVRCWGNGSFGRLGYGDTKSIGDNEPPANAGPVDLGGGHKAKAVSAGRDHTCAILDDGSVRCWGFGANGQLGYGTTATIGDDETPGSVAPVDLGLLHTAKAISAGGEHTCAILDDNSVRCWGYAGFGQLGYAGTTAIGDDEAPGSLAAVDLGAGRSAVAISTGALHTCALLDDASVRCWGYGSNGRLGYCNQVSIGDDEPPSAAGPVDLGSGGAGCPATPAGAGPAPPGAGPAPAPADDTTAAGDQASDPIARQAARARLLRGCLRAAARRATSARQGARATCLRRYGRTPGRVARLSARAVSRTRVVLTFAAPGSDGQHAPAARAYLVRQSLRPIRGPRAFARAHALCAGSCRFSVTVVGTKLTLTVKDLRPRTTYYYAVAARDNVSNRLGQRSPASRTRTR